MEAEGAWERESTGWRVEMLMVAKEAYDELFLGTKIMTCSLALSKASLMLTQGRL